MQDIMYINNITKTLNLIIADGNVYLSGAILAYTYEEFKNNIIAIVTINNTIFLTFI